MAKKGDNQTIDIFPHADSVQRIRRARKEIEDIKPIDIIDQLDDIIDTALDGEKPQCSAAVSAVVAKAKILGFMEVKQVIEEKPQRKVIFEVIDANHKKPTNPPAA